jgi:C4-dicarboxylate transporter DctM subunit
MVLTMAVVAPVLIVFGFPMWLILAVISLISLVFFLQIPLSIVAQTMFGSLNEFVLLAIPLFILAGHLMSHGSIAQRLIDWAKSMIGHLPGGLAITSVGVNEIFGAISGSAPATTATLGKILYPALRADGYGERFSVGLLASMGALSTIVPPSVNMILFSAAANVSVAQLFLAGVVPSVVIAIIVAAYCMWWARRHLPRNALPDRMSRPPLATAERADERSSPVSAPRSRIRLILDETRKAALALGVPLIIFGGIYSGLATPTEVAALACLYAVIVSVVVYREMDLNSFFGAVGEAAKVTAQIFIIMSAAGLFAWVLAIGQVPQGLVAAIEASGLPWWAILLLINLLLLGVGMFMDPVSAIVILTPILVPVATAVGIDPIHLGMVVVINLAIGMFTPPFGLNLFVAMSIFEAPMARIVRGLLPFLALYLLALALVTYIPLLSLWLPSLLYR